MSSDWEGEPWRLTLPETWITWVNIERHRAFEGRKDARITESGPRRLRIWANIELAVRGVLKFHTETYEAKKYGFFGPVVEGRRVTLQLGERPDAAVPSFLVDTRRRYVEDPNPSGSPSYLPGYPQDLDLWGSIMTSWASRGLAEVTGFFGKSTLPIRVRFTDRYLTMEQTAAQNIARAQPEFASWVAQDPKRALDFVGSAGGFMLVLAEAATWREPLAELFDKPVVKRSVTPKARKRTSGQVAARALASGAAHGTAGSLGATIGDHLDLLGDHGADLVGSDLLSDLSAGADSSGFFGGDGGGSDGGDGGG